MLVSRLGEEALLGEIRALFKLAPSKDVAVGIGDDAALLDIPAGRQAVLTTDMLLEGVHFEKSWQAPWQLGFKAHTVNLSDIAAMGATPRYSLISIACPGDTEVEFLLEICRGFLDLATSSNVAVIGGDTTSSKSGLIISVTAGGDVPRKKALLRSGAGPGELIVASGFLGSAAAGLKLLQENRSESYEDLRRAFISPRAEIDLAREAGESGATSMTDLSDGLASDLSHICQESGVGAVIERDRLPVSQELLDAARRFGWDADSLVFSGGEDYGLIFTMPPAGNAAKMIESLAEKTGRPLSIIGKTKLEPGIMVSGGGGGETPLKKSGFDHFLSS